MNETFRTLVEYADTPHLEEFLDWQVSVGDSDKPATDLVERLRDNRARHRRQARHFEGEVIEKRMQQFEADRLRRNDARSAAYRASEWIWTRKLSTARLEKPRIEYRNERDGTAIEIPEVNEAQLENDFLSAQADSLRDISLQL
jgi:hypothetical protein